MATLTNQYRSSSLNRYQGNKGTAARTRRRIRREISRLPQYKSSLLREMYLSNQLLNEQLLVAQGLQEVEKAQVTKYKLLGYLNCLNCLPSQEKEVEVEGKEVEAKLNTLCAGLACALTSTLLVGVMGVIHWGPLEWRCKMLPEEARGYNNPVSVCYTFK